MAVRVFARATLPGVEIRSLGYRTDLMIRLLEGSQVENRGAYLVIRTPQNPGFWWGNFLLLATPPRPGQAGDWLARFAAEFPGAAHVALGVDAAGPEEVDAPELIAAGLRITRLVVLTASEVHPPPRPNTQASYRTLAGDEDWRQAARLRAAISSGEPGGDAAFLRARLAAERALTEAGHGSWFGAFLGGDLVAQLGVITGDGGLGRYQSVETHPAARRQGLAGSLVWHAGQEVLASGRAGKLVIVADPGDIAIGVYRSAGFADAQVQTGFERRPPASHSQAPADPG